MPLSLPLVILLISSLAGLLIFFVYKTNKKFKIEVENIPLEIQEDKTTLPVSKDEAQRVEVYVLNETRIVNGVGTRVTWDKVWLDGELVEDNQTLELLKVEFKEPVLNGRAAKISEAEARKIALNRVPGYITNVSIERKFGELAYVIAIEADDGPEAEVVIDIDTGEILAVEV